MVKRVLTSRRDLIIFLARSARTELREFAVVPDNFVPARMKVIFFFFSLVGKTFAEILIVFTFNYSALHSTSPYHSFWTEDDLPVAEFCHKSRFIFHLLFANFINIYYFY